MRDDPVVLTGAGILLVAGIFLAYPITAAIAAGIAAAWYATRHLARAHQARTQPHHELLEHANREHALVLKGDPAGMYGQYPPANTNPAA